jgi:hypothetical protein
MVNAERNTLARSDRNAMTSVSRKITPPIQPSQPVQTLCEAEERATPDAIDQRPWTDAAPLGARRAGARRRDRCGVLASRPQPAAQDR